MTIVHNIRRFMLVGFLFIVSLLTGCRLDMRDQPRYEPLEASTFFANGAAVRPRIADTVARGEINLDDQLHTGRVNGQVADSFPFTVTVAVLERGQERYNIFCAPCHGLVGDGQGIVTDYGMPAPASFHDPALRDETTGYYFTVITNGTRVMPSYASRIRPEDRWAIIAYVRALQLSQNAAADQLSPEDLPQLEQSQPITK